MVTSRRYILQLLVFFALGMVVYSGTALAETVFTRNLHLGMSGEDVRTLQKILNSDIATNIGGFGPGSPGQETVYFGALTKDAVIRFQEKYRQEILDPNFLDAGTGFVGPSTLAVLSVLESKVVSVKAPQIQPTTPVQTTTIPATVAATTNTNPNTVNIDQFFADIDKISAKQNIPASTVSMIKSKVTQEVATTTDLRKKFIQLVKKTTVSSVQQRSLFAGALVNITRVLEKVFTPDQAQAFGGTPFGGALIFPFYCDCSDTWLIALEPLPPTYPVLLTYVPFSQALLSYNIPDTQWLLGEYENGGGECEVYVVYGCLSIPNEGMITPFVGSSPI